MPSATDSGFGRLPVTEPFMVMPLTSESVNSDKEPSASFFARTPTTPPIPQTFSEGTLSLRSASNTSTVSCPFFVHWTVTSFSFPSLLPQRIPTPDKCRKFPPVCPVSSKLRVGSFNVRLLIFPSTSQKSPRYSV